MLWNYNGDVNRSTLRDLKKLCKVNAENLDNLLKAYAKNGKVSFNTNLDPFTGCPDEMSETVTLKSEEEIKEYLKADFQERLDEYLAYHKPAEDYLLNALIDFIKENGDTYPSKDEFRQLEITAENKRIAASPVTTDSQDFDPEQEMLKEILQLAEEIMETKRENDPKAITIHLEPYPDTLNLSNDDFYININWDRYYGNGNNSDYRVVIIMKDDYLDVETIEIYSHGTAFVNAENCLEKEVDDPILIKDQLIAIHQSIVQMAEQEGIEFLSEIDYTKLSA